MEDYQQWSRRDLGYKPKSAPEYLFNPKRTPLQTFVFSVTFGCTLMVISYIMFRGSEKYHEKTLYKIDNDRKLRKSLMATEMYSLGIRDDRMRAFQKFRRQLRLPDQPRSSCLISDPDIKNPQPRGQMTL